MKINLRKGLMSLLAIAVLLIFSAFLYQNLVLTSTETGLSNQPSQVATQALSPTDSPVRTGGVTAGTFIPDPVNTVYDFYEAVANKHCAEATAIRPDYTQERCMEINAIQNIDIQLLQQDKDRAAVRLQLTYMAGGVQKPAFNGYLWLKRELNQPWKIQPDIISETDITADKFLLEKADIIPKALSDTQAQDANAVQLPPNQTAEKPTALAESTDKQDTNSSAFPTIVSSLGKQFGLGEIKSFGSQTILNACWTPEQLRGNPTDKKLQETTPNHKPPERLRSNHSLTPLPKGLEGSIRTVRLPDPDKKLVALTFDLCERAGEITGYDADIINYLRDNGIKATFYAGGKWMRSHPDKAKQLMADPLFEIGNHAWTHGNMRVLSGEELQTQVLWTQTQYELLWEELARDVQQCRGVSPTEINKIPPLPLSFRYPYGTCGTEALDFMAEQGLPSIQWNIVTADPWRKQTADGIAKTIVQGIKPGSIIIAHANGRGWKTSDALPQFIPALQKRGYQFVTVTELLASGKEVEATDTCYELKPGDNQFYDQKVGKGTE